MDAAQTMPNSQTKPLPTTAVALPLVISSRGEHPAPSSPVIPRPVFARDTSNHIPQSQPAPPTGRPPESAFGSVGRTPPGLRAALEICLPNISHRSTEQSPEMHKSVSAPSLFIVAIREQLESALKAEEEEIAAARRRVEQIVTRPGQWDSLLTALAKADESLTSIPELRQLAELFRAPRALSHGIPQPVESSPTTESELETRSQLAAWKLLDDTIHAAVDSAGQMDEIWQILAKVQGQIRTRKSAEAKLRAESTARELAKAKRMAEVRHLAKEATRVAENNGTTATDDAEREEIKRALAAVDETRRKRMERQQTEGGAIRQDDEKLRRRQVKREQLMKKRKNMEERLEEEASKMAQLTESAKKKGESKFMSEAAKRDAEERIRVEGEIVAQLELQAVQMAAHRATMQRQLEECEDREVADTEASSVALKAKRTLLQERMRQEEEELKTLSESAKRKVESKMIAEAAAIAVMERQACQLAAKRAELEAQVLDRLRLESTLVQESQKLTDKRQAMEAKMRKEEEELQKLSDEAKRRVMEKMAGEAAVIADMERQANELANARATIASQLATQRAEIVPMVAKNEDAPAQSQNEDTVQTTDRAVYRTGGESAHTTHVVDDAWQQKMSSDGKSTRNESTHGMPDSLSSIHGENEGGSGIDNRTLRFAPDSTTSGSPSPYEGQDFIHVPLDGPIMGNANHSKDLREEPSLNETTALNICAQCRRTELHMSAAHVAAAAGHTTCLEEIQLDHPALMIKLDSAGRSPLFYACANAHADAADILVREGPQCCYLMDANGDTPLHAAALAGSALCCQILLQQDRIEVEPCNTMNMTPAHLAGNNDVLEVLSQHGANLNAKDVDLRTPLFVACATDRLEKAEFLCELLECAGQDLGEADKRGDTPMHAAACNGSTACLLLLLQYGVAPDIRNLKGLRPIDLASRKGQSACEKILMEYQLHHHVNNSYFDSVLFLATLEGYKRCKEAFADRKQDHSVTSPTLGRTGIAGPETSSLSRDRSIRLEHWGNWIAYEDQNSRSVLWYNHVAQTSQWEPPAEVREANVKHTANSSMRLQRAGDWIEYTLPDGNVFSYNDNTNDFQWQRPDQMSPEAGTGEWAGEDGLKEHALKEFETVDGEWGAFQDPSTGLVFWYNHVTGESRWDSPDDIVAVDGVRNEEPTDGQEILTQEEVVRAVTSVDELFTPR